MDRFRTGYRWMLLARMTEEKIASLYRTGKIVGGVFLGKGQEALSTAVGMSLRKGDYLAPLIRDQAARMAFGEPLLDTLRTYMGVRSGPMRGRDGNIHRGRPSEGVLAMISHLGAMVPALAGVLMAHRFQGIQNTIGATCIGDGGTSTGAFHEGLNLAAVERLPMVVVVANNQYAYSTPNTRQFVCNDLVDKALGYGIDGHSADGTCLQSCLEVLQLAADRARSGHGPQLVVASLLRLTGHGEHDDGSYIDPLLRKTPVGRDCLKLAEEKLLANSWATPAEIALWHSETQQHIEDSVAVTLREPLPDPAHEDWCALSNRHLAEG
jgi:pyruvate dehydrogenase E1 component alpha subunit/2-oxoisovalerate dehydrogenase E1 component alpha subunit